MALARVLPASRRLFFLLPSSLSLESDPEPELKVLESESELDKLESEPEVLESLSPLPESEPELLESLSLELEDRFFLLFFLSLTGSDFLMTSIMLVNEVYWL